MRALVVSARFLAVAARFHIAPAPTAVAAVVEEEPLAIGRSTFTNGGAIFRGKKIGSGLGNGPENTLEKIRAVGLPLPTIVAVRADQFAMLQRLEREVVDLLDVLETGMLTCGQCGKGPVESLAEDNGFAEHASTFGLAAARADP